MHFLWSPKGKVFTLSELYVLFLFAGSVYVCTLNHMYRVISLGA